MTHFSLVVQATDWNDVFRKMLPFHEFGFGMDIPDEEKMPHVVFRNGLMDADLRARYQKETVQRVVVPGEGEFFTWDRRFEARTGLQFGRSPFDTTQSYPEGATIVERTFPEIYPTFEDWLIEFHSFQKVDEYSIGYWINPNARWDWYEPIDEYFSLKAGGLADVAEAQEIDFELMLQRRELRELAVWDQARQVYARAGIDFDHYLTLPMEQAQAIVEQASKIDLADHELIEMIHFTPLATTLEQHIEMSIGRGLAWAFIDQAGQWHEFAKMGAFGSFDEPDDAYGRKVAQFIKSLAPDALLFAVGCHI